MHEARILLNALSVGEEIQAWHNGKIYYQGVVLSMIPSLNLISISCVQKGAVRLIDAEVVRVTRVPSNSQRPRSAVPLFREPLHASQETA